MISILLLDPVFISSVDLVSVILLEPISVLDLVSYLVFLVLALDLVFGSDLVPLLA